MRESVKFRFRPGNVPLSGKPSVFWGYDFLFESARILSSKLIPRLNTQVAFVANAVPGIQKAEGIGFPVIPMAIWSFPICFFHKKKKVYIFIIPTAACACLQGMEWKIGVVASAN